MEIETLLVQTIRAHRKQLRLAGMLVLALGALGIIAFFSGVMTPDGTRRTTRAILYSFVGVPVGLGIILMSLRDPRKVPAVVLLREQPKKIVWEYLSVPVRAPWMSKASLQWMAKPSTLVLRTDDGSEHRVPISFADETRVQAALKQALPHATHGFSPAAKAKFQSMR